jgi:hypothetical protein
MLVVPLGLAETATRMLVGTASNGMPEFRSLPLLPFRPDFQLVEARLSKASDSGYMVPDPELGWTVVRDGMAELYESNSQGVRARRDRVYGAQPPPGKTRIVTLGDSFTHGDGVRNAETWQAQLEQMRSDLEVLNLGVPAYGTDQAFLRWRRAGSALRGDIVLLGIWPENVCRNLNVVRYYLNPSGGYLSKPRFVLEDGGLTLANVPVVSGEAFARILSDPAGTALLRWEFWYDERETRPRWYDRSTFARILATLHTLYLRREIRQRLYSGEDPVGNLTTTAIARRFAEEVRASGATPLVLLIPMRDLLKQYPDENSLPLVRSLRAGGIDVLDLGPAFAARAREGGLEALFLPDGHFSPRGNEFLAQKLEALLDPWLPSSRRSGRGDRPHAQATAAQGGRPG